MPPDYWKIGKKQHFICSNLTLFIVLFFLSFFFSFFLSFFLSFFFFSRFPWGWGATAPQPPQMTPLLKLSTVLLLYKIIEDSNKRLYRLATTLSVFYQILFTDFYWIHFIRIALFCDGLSILFFSAKIFRIWPTDFNWIFTKDSKPSSLNFVEPEFRIFVCGGQEGQETPCYTQKIGNFRHRGSIFRP